MWDLFEKKRTGLVLGGGGARGFYHVGVIKGLQELKIRVDEIAGTSIGAVVGAMWAANPDLDIEKTAMELDFLKIIKMMIWGGGWQNTEEISKYIREFVRAERFEDLKIKLKFNATDINKKEEVVFDRGELFPGLIASVSIPGIFPPVKYEDRYLVDGGVANNIPVSLIGRVTQLIVSDITGPFKQINEKSPGVDVLYSSIAMMQQKGCLEKIKEAGIKKMIYLNLEDDKTLLIDFRKQNFQKLTEAGYKAVITKKAELQGV